jgi:hypothetical protein
MKRKIIILTILVLVLLTACRPSKAFAETVTRYTTKTVSLKDKVKGKTIYKVKRNTKVKQLKAGNTWSKVKYKKKTLYVQKRYLHKEKSPAKYTGAYFKKAGVIWWHDKKYTYYSQRVLPGYGLKIPGRHLDKQGFVCDKNEYIVLGSNTGNRNKIIATPFGKFGKVYDAGYVGTYWFDCYTNW